MPLCTPTNSFLGLHAQRGHLLAVYAEPEERGEGQYRGGFYRRRGGETGTERYVSGKGCPEISRFVSGLLYGPGYASRVVLPGTFALLVERFFLVEVRGVEFVAAASR